MSIKKNYVYNTFYQIFNVLIPLILVPYTSRVLGVNGVGEYAYTSSYTQYFILLGMLGITLYGRREIAYVKNNRELLNKKFSNIYALQVTTMILAYLMYILIFVIINKNNRDLYLIQSLLIFGNIFDISWFFIGIENLKSVVIRNFIIKIISILSIFVFVKESNDLLVYALIMGLNVLIGQLIMWLNIKGKVSITKLDINEIKIHINQSLKLFVAQLSIQIYVVLDKTMLGIMSDTTQVGLYDNSQKMIKTILALVTSIAIVMMPRMSSLYAENNMDEFKRLMNKVFSFVNFIGIPITVGLMAISESFSAWFYGKEFEGIENLLVVGSIIIIAISWSNVLGNQIMIPMKKEKQFTISVTIGAISNLLLNVILIRKLGAMGSTISTVAAELIVAFVQFYFLRELMDIKYVLSTFYKPILCAVPMYVVVKLSNTVLPINIIGTTFSVIIGIFVYALFSYLLRQELFSVGLEQIKNIKIVRKYINEKV